MNKIISVKPLDDYNLLLIFSNNEKRIKDMKPYIEISESTLYPILRRLEAAKFLTVHSVEHNGRLRKYYHITDLGKARITNFKEEFREVMDIYRFVTREEGQDE